MVETTVQVLARQQEQAASAIVNANAAPQALTGVSNPWVEISAALDQFLGSPLLKFNKQGEYALNDVDTIAEGVRCIARVDEVQFGWIKWTGSQVADRLMFRVADRLHPPRRSELDDMDQTSWEIQADGTRRDPWQFQATLPLTRLGTDESYNFIASSKGGLTAINKLVRTYGARLAGGRPGLPVIELQSGSYKHRSYGKIFFPVLSIVNWTDDGGKPLSLAADLSDEIPHP